MSHLFFFAQGAEPQTKILDDILTFLISSDLVGSTVANSHLSGDDQRTEETASHAAGEEEHGEEGAEREGELTPGQDACTVLDASMTVEIECVEDDQDTKEALQDDSQDDTQDDTQDPSKANT